ncbi:MAG: PAS domain S-box protein [Proteobacteria bacterium]|nr:PAS domain S-box protein [Pseudomonadota bacterium]MBU1570225.1 PAS domain S-box protein [Pseudomonadota bacterium]
MTGEIITPPQGEALPINSGQALHQRAEEVFREKAAGMEENMEALSPDEVRQILHELRVYQVELEMQNEELRRTQGELDASRVRYFDLYDLAPVGYVTVSEKGQILETNLTAAILFGVTRGALLKQILTRFIHKEDQAIYYLHSKQLFETGELQTCELRMVKKDGVSFWASLAATGVHESDGASVCRIVMRDITERKQAEAALQQAYDELEERVVARTKELQQANKDLLTGINERKQAEKDLVETVQQLQETRDMLIQFEKFAALGRMACGIAHELLNPASIISSQLQFMEDETLTDKVRESVRICREQMQRIAKISHGLLQSSAKKITVLVGGDLRHVIEVSLQMTERRRKEDHVQVEYNPLPESIPVKMERDRLVKVVVNLILNACDAMTDKHSKRIIIAVYRPEASSIRPFVRLIIADNGHGILEGELDKIFEPFFTRKDPGKGTGLGLSVSRGIIQEHGGTIHAENNDMGGASLIVELPLDHP